MIFNRAVELEVPENMMGYALRQEGSIAINDYQHAKWRNYLTPPIEKLFQKVPCVLHRLK